MNTEQEFEQLVEGLKALRGQLEIELREVRIKADGIRARMRRIDKMVTEPGKQSNSKSKKHGNGNHGPSPQLVSKVREAIVELSKAPEGVIPDVPGSFIAASISQATGIHSTSVAKAMQELRALGEIRQVGSAPREKGATGTPARAYVASVGVSAETK